MVLAGNGPIILFAAAAAIVILIMICVARQRAVVAQRLATATASGKAGSLGKGVKLGVTDSHVEKQTQRRLKQEERQRKMRERLQHAGFYDRAAAKIFAIVRVLMIVGAGGLGFMVSRVMEWPLGLGMMVGGGAGVLATVAPSLYLDHVKARRQSQIRRALPDALDVMVVCLEGGLSIMGALSRVAKELAVAHPMLAVELKIVERQMQLGQNASDALAGMAARFDMEELRSMASVIRQAEKVGSSVVSALQVFAESMRLKRYQRAEEMAQKASVKIMFPTLLCIFPAVFVVILGPAAIQVYQTLILGVMQQQH